MTRRDHDQGPDDAGELAFRQALLRSADLDEPSQAHVQKAWHSFAAATTAITQATAEVPTTTPKLHAQPWHPLSWLTIGVIAGSILTATWLGTATPTSPSQPPSTTSPTGRVAPSSKPSPSKPWPARTTPEPSPAARQPSYAATPTTRTTPESARSPPTPRNAKRGPVHASHDSSSITAPVTVRAMPLIDSEIKRLGSAATLALARALWFALLPCLGCGAGDAGGEPDDVYSESFFPLEAHLADGTAATRLHWLYRANRGEAVPYLDQPGAMVQFDDSEWTVEDGKLKQSHAFEISIPSPLGSTTTTSETTSRLTGAQPHAMTSADTFTMVTAVSDGERSWRRLGASFTYDPPRKFLYDRDDLDLLDVSYSESQEFHASSEQRHEDSDGEKREPRMLESDHRISWTLLEKHESFEVAGRSYRNVVEVRFESSSGATAIQWLAKGVGLLRSEYTSEMPTGSEIALLELIDSNLTQR